MKPARKRQKVPIALRRARIRRIDADGACHTLGILLQVEDSAVGKEAAPLGIEATQLEHALEALSGLGEDAREDAGQGQDRRSHIEAKAAFLQHGRLAAEPVVLLEQPHLVAAPGKHDRSGKPRQPAADHHDGSIAAHHFTSAKTGGRVPARLCIGRGARPRSCCSSPVEIKADWKITGRPLPGCVPPPTR